MSSAVTEARPGPATLRGWKTIAAHFGRDERTVMRWAEQRGLPVRRLPGGGRSSVFALATELDEWLASTARGPQVPDAEPSVPDAPSDPVPMPIGTRPEPQVVPVAPLVAAPTGPAVSPTRYGLPAFGAALLAVLALVLVFGHRAPAAVAPGEDEVRDPAAEQSFLQASYDLNQRTPASLQRAKSEFGAAIAADPSAAPAYAGLAETFLLLREFSDFPDREAFNRAASAASAAIALNPDLASAHRVLAVVAFWQRRDIPLARAEFQKAIALAPRDALTHHWYATALSGNAEYGAALREMGEARRLDPQSTALLADYGLLLYLAGQRAAGLAMLRRVVVDQPGGTAAHAYLGGFALCAGDGTTYLREAGLVARLRDDQAGEAEIAAEAAAFARGGMRALLDVKWQRKLALVRRTHEDYYGLATIAALQGDAPRALQLLQTARGRGEVRAIAFGSDLGFARLMDRPEFAALARRPSLAA